MNGLHRLHPILRAQECLSAHSSILPEHSSLRAPARPARADPRRLVTLTGRAKVQIFHKSTVRARPKPGRVWAAYWTPGPNINLNHKLNSHQQMLITRPPFVVNQWLKDRVDSGLKWQEIYDLTQVYDVLDMSLSTVKPEVHGVTYDQV
ncbi:hypothetical protein PGTUg99_013297 [Puccinia graminis f. sp. tritici]|uniref:Uncharacterized protein n=1 Tax=Puccinia graminis f. sp. tritici TaxID=56615 RepID=A0A5B0SAE2_PUCGR|nr:hypothetical protein PGTUg99_013297 [Puccinia graminis f. sp. tritici]